MTNPIDAVGHRSPTSNEDIDHHQFSQRLENHLAIIYPDADRQSIVDRIVELGNKYQLDLNRPSASQWNQQDNVLICYGDNLYADSQPTLGVMNQFLRSQELESLIKIIHLLPINPYTSDDGFSVVDYREVDERLGTWDDVDELNERFELMLDLVLNHCSQQSEWFQGFLAGSKPYTDYFIEVDPKQDLSSVVRPRSLPLLSEKQTANGSKFVWTTFSDDQIDLNFACPNVMIEILDILLLYASHGARIVRLDAIAYLWKKVGTRCIHLKETHEVVKLMRTVIDRFAPGTLLMTETNVPHRENISYFGDGDEARMIYQFSLPPLLLDGYLQETAATISRWLKSVCESPNGTTFFNFTASHDGIGVRPLEGLVPQENLDRIVEQAVSRGGKIGTKTNADGSSSPYELNVTYLDMLLTEPQSDQPGIDRFMASQAVMLSLKGIPGIYFHSLFGTQNDIPAAEESGIPRRINRRKFAVDELNQRLQAENSIPQQVFQKYKQLLSIRKSQLAFHPDAGQSVVDCPNETLLVFRRCHEDSREQITVVANFSAVQQTVDVDQLPEPRVQTDLISRRQVEQGRIEVPPFGVLWLQ